MKEKEMSKREYIPFFRSFYETIKDFAELEFIDVAEQLSLYKAVVEYGLDGVEPQLTKKAAAVWRNIYKNVESSRKKFEKGSMGGAPKGNSNAVKRRSHKIKQPMPIEVYHYCSKKGIEIDQEKFYNHYNANKWVTENPYVKTWQDAVEVWAQTKERNGYKG